MLKPYIGKLDRLPRTRSLLDQVLYPRKVNSYPLFKPG